MLLYFSSTDTIETIIQFKKVYKNRSKGEEVSWTNVKLFSNHIVMDVGWSYIILYTHVA